MMMTPDQPHEWARQLENQFASVGWPSTGQHDLWLWWFVRNLSILDDHGWFDLLGWGEGKIGELWGIEETIFALRWIAEDACHAGEDFGGHVPLWEDWFAGFCIPVIAPMVAAEGLPAWSDEYRFFQGLYAVMFGEERDEWYSETDIGNHGADDERDNHNQLLTAAQGRTVNEWARIALDPNELLGEKLSLLDWTNRRMPVRVQGEPPYLGETE